MECFLFSYKSLVLLSVSEFQKKIVGPRRALQNKRGGARAIYTLRASRNFYKQTTAAFAKKRSARTPYESRVRARDRGPRKLWCRHLNASSLLTNAAKTCRQVSHTLLQKPRSFKRFSILEDYCSAAINNGTFKSTTFVNKLCKMFWVSYTFLQKPSLFKHF